MSDDPSSSNDFLTEVGRYAHLSEARERGLVVSAMELPHWIQREGDVFILRVEQPCRNAVLRELEKFEAERHERATIPSRPEATGPVGTLSLFIVAWLLSAFWLLQNSLPESYSEAGAAVSVKIVASHEWWRAVTALTLHGDVAHLAANLATGLLFAAFVTAQFGSGLAWLAIVLAGIVGNLLNALLYAGETHVSIGASTAVFGALGLLVAAEFIARAQSPAERRWWYLVLPLGAGLALLAYLGVGDEQKHVDYMAHLSGFVAGMALGAMVRALRLRDRLGPAGQRVTGLVAFALVAFAWWRALQPIA